MFVPTDHNQAFVGTLQWDTFEGDNFLCFLVINKPQMFGDVMDNEPAIHKSLFQWNLNFPKVFSLERFPLYGILLININRENQNVLVCINAC